MFYVRRIYYTMPLDKYDFPIIAIYAFKSMHWFYAGPLNWLLNANAEQINE